MISIRMASVRFFISVTRLHDAPFDVFLFFFPFVFVVFFDLRIPHFALHRSVRIFSIVVQGMC